MRAEDVNEDARTKANLEYDITDEEIDRLVADDRFAKTAYLYDEVMTLNDTVSPVLDNRDADDIEEIRDRTSEHERDAFRRANLALDALKQTMDDLAADILGEAPEEKEFAEVLEEQMISDDDS